MKTLPPRANLDHLKKQAKALLRLYRDCDPLALARFAESLPAAAGRSAAEIQALGLRLHDAQSCIAREYGFVSWAELTLRVEASGLADAISVEKWLDLAYGGDVTGTYAAARPRLAVRLLQEQPALAGDIHVACAAGDEVAIARQIASDPQWVHRPDGPLNLPPLVAVTHSRLGELLDFIVGLRASARRLLQAGADPNQRIFNRYPPASLAKPDEAGPLSALYGAAGVIRDVELTEILLGAGADPNDGESLYHSLENPDVTRLLLKRGARISGTNALRRALDMPEPTAIELLLEHGGDPNEPVPAGPTNTWGSPLLRAIALRCSDRHIAALLAAGADPRAQTANGVGTYRLAMQVGLTEVADRLRDLGAGEDLALDEAFVAACARGDVAEAKRIQKGRPDLPRSLRPDQLRLMPDSVAWGSKQAVKAMVECGWPLDVRGGDWDATALNHAVFRGDPELTEFLLAHGASWREGNGFGGNVLGSLSWASINEPSGIGDPDWEGCARALLAHGLRLAERYPANPELVLIEGQKMSFSEGVTEILLGGASDSV